MMPRRAWQRPQASGCCCGPVRASLRAAIPVAGFAICLWLVAQSKADDWVRVSVLLAIGIALYLAEKWYYGRK